MSAEPYTRDEMTDDLIEWGKATKEQRDKVFIVLLACVTADAYHQQDFDLIDRLRALRAERDEVQP